MKTALRSVLGGVVLFVAFASVAWGSKMEGTYTNTGGMVVLDLKSGGKATFTMMGESLPCTYKTSGDKPTREWREKMRLSLLGFIGVFVVLVAINASAATAEMPDILGIQLGMPAREAHAKLQTELPKNKIQVVSTNLPTIEKPVIASFVSEPTQTIMIGMVF